MFYSQFILAKKGPLGTIWIAAHLERKLKKNQVADTDIGVSVDSILFPEVPIALRLSSHLLLGVVKIYSRKVNYLFHDCSEALLKVKQAFRSTAVDLPPEESTAPYHSITLPETFDLDDFELPDSALISGNFDDRHVSTREQITLQDTLDGTGYSTSQFGLDERFGDGDTSQIGLDLDEELLLDNNLTLQDASVLDGAVHQGEGLTKMDIDEGQHGHDEDQNDDASKELSDLLSNNRGKHVVSNPENVNRHDDSSHRLIFNIQTPDLNEVFLSDDLIGGPSAPHDIEMDFAAAADPPSPEFNESANFPSTSGLFLEEAIQANSHELPAGLHKNSPSTVVEAVELDKHFDQEVECPDAINAASTSPKTVTLAQVVSSPTSVLAEPKPDSVEAGPDAANNCNLTPVEPTDPKPADNSQVLLSSTSAPQCPGETMTTTVTCGEANAQPVSLENSLISGMASGIDGITLADTARLSNFDQGRAEDAHSCQTGNVTALSCDFHLRSCTTADNQANLISPEVMVQERAEGFSFREQPCYLETPMVDQEFNFIGSSADFQGFRSAIATGANLVGDQKSNNVPAGHGNCFSRSEFSEPERMRFAPFGNVNLLNDLGQQTTERGVIESDGTVDRISTLSGHKRHLIDSNLDLQNGISPKMSGIPRKKQNFDYIPNDDDLLASILVGRTPALRVGPTPPLPKPPPIKRPRVTNKVGLLKRRKVQLDDKIVLHADAIRQQLINTEDIRRIRKKVPCTRSEIWRIQKSSLEGDIFCESIFTGISEELNSFLTRRYDLAQNVHSQINGQHSSGEAAKGLELSKSSILVGENDGKEMAEQSTVVPKRIDGEMQGPSGILELIQAESTDALERLESSHDPHHIDLPGHDPHHMDLPGHDPHHMDLPGNTISRGDLADVCANPEQNSLNNSHELAEVNNNIVHVVAANNETSLQGEDFSNAKDVSVTVEDMSVDIVNVANLNRPRDGSANIGKDENGGTAVSMLNRFIVEVGADFPADSSTVIGYANSSVPDKGLVDDGPVSSAYQAMKDSEEGRVTAVSETVVDDERPDSEFPCGERPHRTESEQVPSAVGENSCMNIESGVDAESTPVELAATKEPSDFCSTIDDIDTDFLNVDDEVEYDDEINDDVPNTEAVQLENSGWSSRTRGVARYLKNMLDQESGRGRKSVAIDQLLAGKTRKEASRMFFETLVLKTKDYIHVEQENPFNLVNVKPRIKLLKSEF